MLIPRELITDYPINNSSGVTSATALENECKAQKSESEGKTSHPKKTRVFVEVVA